MICGSRSWSDRSGRIRLNVKRGEISIALVADDDAYAEVAALMIGRYFGGDASRYAVTWVADGESYKTEFASSLFGFAQAVWCRIAVRHAPLLDSMLFIGSYVTGIHWKAIGEAGA